ncbi:MAG: rRNA methyltransferase [Treponema sp.]|jgi:hypothetical protein|nr:rRNA methyltransferase [Treponema sp.]
MDFPPKEQVSPVQPDSVFSPAFPAELSGEGRLLLEGFPGLVDKVFPLPGRFRAGLGRDVAELSRLLTSGRGDLPEGYLGRPPLLSAYLRYFLPWNLYRLVRLLPALPLALTEGDAVTDLGSGPLTLPLALWIARPEFRSLSLEFRCLDRTEAALKAGKRLFAALAGPESPWKIRTIHDSLDAPVKGKPAALVTAVNVYNEVFGDLPHTDNHALAQAAGREARRLAALSVPGGGVLIVEPGVPRSGEFIACLRAALLERGLPPLSPCTHAGPCPFPGGRAAPAGRRTAGEKQKWCHFVFDTGDAPPKLLELSVAAGLPKERAALSFVFACGAARSGPSRQAGMTETAVRILSDPFPLPEGGQGGRYGRYGCSERGAVLAAGEKQKIYALNFGALLRTPLPAPDTERRDPKSGAPVVEVR